MLLRERIGRQVEWVVAGRVARAAFDVGAPEDAVLGEDLAQHLGHFGRRFGQVQRRAQVEYGEDAVGCAAIREELWAPAVVLVFMLERAHGAEALLGQVLLQVMRDHRVRRERSHVGVVVVVVGCGRGPQS